MSLQVNYLVCAMLDTEFSNKKLSPAFRNTKKRLLTDPGNCLEQQGLVRREL